MKRYFRTIVPVFLLLVALGVFFNLETSIQQCVDYRCQSVRMPLYLKMLDFFDRHFNYAHLVRGIIKGAKTEEERVMRIFAWTDKYIKEAPPGLPVMDDHVWYTIVRGYGVGDQFQDVFTTLCNYAGVDAFFQPVYTKDFKQKIPLSFVKINKRWYLFDAYNSAFFTDTHGKITDIEGMKSREWKAAFLAGGPRKPVDYSLFMDNLPLHYAIELGRSNTQSPLNRLWYEFKKKGK